MEFSLIIGEFIKPIWEMNKVIKQVRFIKVQKRQMIK